MIKYISIFLLSIIFAMWVRVYSQQCAEYPFTQRQVLCTEEHLNCCSATPMPLTTHSRLCYVPDWIDRVVCYDANDQVKCGPITVGRGGGVDQEFEFEYPPGYTIPPGYKVIEGMKWDYDVGSGSPTSMPSECEGTGSAYCCKYRLTESKGPIVSINVWPCQQ